MKRNPLWMEDGLRPGSPSKTKSKPEEDVNVDDKISHQSRTNDKTFVKYFKEFTENTSLHGLKYLGEGRRSKTEKIWWAIMLILSMGACVLLISKTWNKWEQSPVIVSFAESSTPVWQVPFPAVTVCSETKVRQTVFNYTKMYLESENITDEEVSKLEAVSLLCSNEFARGNKTMDANSVQILENVSPKLDEMMFDCKWKNSELRNCERLFTPILTEEGFCFTFNMISAEELFRSEQIQSEYFYLNETKKSKGWSLDGGYPAKHPLDTYPVRGTGAGANAGLTIVMISNNDDLDYLCRGPTQGFKILLHTPSEMPRVSQQYFRVPLKQEVIAAIKPNMMTTSKGLKSYDPKRRKCYFPSERRLKFFQVYTQQNCNLECLTNFTLAWCGCVSFSMPRNESTKICSTQNIECMAEAQELLLTLEVQLGLQRRSVDLEDVAARCDCMASCTSITYDAETSQADYIWQRMLTPYGIDLSILPNVSMARAVLYFKESEFITSRRSELYGPTDFLANCGGLLGLFLGFSFLSLVEIIYFLTLRIFCNLRKMTIRRNRTHTGRAVRDVEMDP